MKILPLLFCGYPVLSGQMKTSRFFRSSTILLRMILALSGLGTYASKPLFMIRSSSDA